MKQKIPKPGRACRGGERDTGFFGAPTICSRFGFSGMNDQTGDLSFRLMKPAAQRQRCRGSSGETAPKRQAQMPAFPDCHFRVRSGGSWVTVLPAVLQVERKNSERSRTSLGMVGLRLVRTL